MSHAIAKFGKRNIVYLNTQLTSPYPMLIGVGEDERIKVTGRDGKCDEGALLIRALVLISDHPRTTGLLEGVGESGAPGDNGRCANGDIGDNGRCVPTHVLPIPALAHPTLRELLIVEIFWRVHAFPLDPALENSPNAFEVDGFFARVIVGVFATLCDGGREQTGSCRKRISSRPEGAEVELGARWKP